MDFSSMISTISSTGFPSARSLGSGDNEQTRTEAELIGVHHGDRYAGVVFCAQAGGFHGVAQCFRDVNGDDGTCAFIS